MADSSSTGVGAQSAADARRLLAIYLRDHRGGAALGLSLARRCRDANQDNELGPALAAVEREIDDDRRSLEAIMDRLDVRPSRMKAATAAVADLAGRLKRNGRLIGYSPARRVVELEGLTAGIFTKRHLWQALAAIAEQTPQLDTEELARLIERADAQIDRLDAHHPWASREAFGA